MRGNIRKGCVGGVLAFAALAFAGCTSEPRESVEAARAALSNLRATLASEVVANLGVTLKFNDNDGD